MSNEADQYVPGFVANLRLKPQQTASRLVSCVDADLNYTTPGKLFNADDIDADDDEVEVVTRAPNSPESFANHLRRVGFLKSSAKGRFIESLDKVRMLTDPTNTVMAGMMATKNRASDDKIIEGLFGSSYNGENGTTVTAFPSAQVIAVDNRDFLHDAESVPASGNLPLTVGKLIKAKVMLDQSEIEGQRYFGASAIQLGNLLATTAVTSADYNGIKALVNGETNTFMGFTFVRSERFPVASSIRSCAAWIKGAMQYRERPIENARIAQRPDRSFRWYAYYEVERGSLRRYDTAVVKVNCSEVVL
jgi:hypothetical protein